MRRATELSLAGLTLPGGKQVHLGSFATAEEAALCVARSPEVLASAAAAKRAAASEEGQGAGGPTMPSTEIVKKDGTVPPMPPGAFVKDEEVAPPMPPGAYFKEEEMVPPTPLDEAIEQELEVVVKEEERSDGRTKRRRIK